MPDAPLPNTRRRRELRRAELLDIAVAAIRAEGPSVSMDQIAVLGNITKPVLYRAFGSKEGLYQAVADWFVSQFLADILATIDERRSFGEFVQSLLDAVLARIEGDRSVYHFLMRRARMALSSKTPSADDDFLRRFGNVVGSLIAAELAKTGRDPRPAAVWGHAVVGMINNSADWWLDHLDIPREQMVAWLTPVLWHGFDSFRDL